MIRVLLMGGPLDNRQLEIQEEVAPPELYVSVKRTPRYVEELRAPLGPPPPLIFEVRYCRHQTEGELLVYLFAGEVRTPRLPTIDEALGPQNVECPTCQGEGWVCENHQDVAWREGDGCPCGGAGAPCRCRPGARG